MKDLKKSMFLMVVTLITCFIIIIVSWTGTLQGFKKIDTDDKYTSGNVIMNEGTLPGDINYIFSENSDIYYTKWDVRDSVDLYNILSQKSEAFLKPVNQGYKIDLFCKYGNSIIWKESSSSTDEQDEKGLPDWKLYVRENDNIIKIDEKYRDSEDSKEDLEVCPGKLSVYSNYLVYKACDAIPGTNEKGIVLKLYDLASNEKRVIFSLSNVKGASVSDPYIYKNTVSWSVCRSKYSSSESTQGDIYIYDVVSGSYRRLTEGEPYAAPIIWENSVICQRQEGYKTGITIIDISNGKKKDIASADISKSPVNEPHDYSAGGGYVAWNTSNADSVCVYDILNDRVYKLKECEKNDKSDNSLINVYIYNKTLLYTDHIFSRKSGRTISETNKYLLLK